MSTIWIFYFHATDWSVWFSDLLLVTASGLRDTDVIWWKNGVWISHLGLQGSNYIMGSLKSPCTTSYRSSIETIPLNWLLFGKIAFFCILVTTDRQTDKQMDIIDAWSLGLAVASYGLIILALLLSEISWLAFRTPLKTDRMHHSIRGVKMTPISRQCDKIGLPVEGFPLHTEVGA